MLSRERFELVPAADIVDRAVRSLEPGAAVSVTALPKQTLEETASTVLALAAAGFDAIPHLPAGALRSREELSELLVRLEDSPVRALFVIGGDHDRGESPFADGGELLEAIRERSGDRFRLGVAAYPEGHPAFDVEAGIRLLSQKAPLADFAITQMCFDAPAVAGFVRAASAAGIELPLWLGTPARVSLARLARIGMRIGVGSSMGMLRHRSHRRLLGSFDPLELRAELEQELAELPEAARSLVAGRHVFTFNTLPKPAPAGRVAADAE